MALLLVSTAEREAVWQRVFAEAGEPIVIGEAAATDPAEITHIAAWVPPKDLGRYTNLKVMLSVAAGVDQMPALPPGVALSRTLAPGIEEMVRDWTVMSVLMLHRDMPAYLDQATRGEWKPHGVPLARNRRIGIMGMGRIGSLTARTLMGMGFQVVGYSQSGRPVEGVEVHGAEALDVFLAKSDILVCLLPLTPQTRGLMDAAFLARLPEGAGLVQAGRGAQLDLDALRAALDAGRIGSAILDVTSPEPLPQDHWAWSDPRVIVTPHIGAMADAEEGARHALAVIRATREGAPIPGLVDPARGY